MSSVWQTASSERLPASVSSEICSGTLGTQGGLTRSELFLEPSGFRGRLPDPLVEAGVVDGDVRGALVVPLDLQAEACPAPNAVVGAPALILPRSMGGRSAWGSGGG